MNSEPLQNPKIITVIARQINEIVKKKPPNIKVIISDTDITDIQADIIGPEQTPYEGGYFRCKLVLQSDFPRSAPKGYFLTKIFHPNVSEKGEICVNTLKKDWNPTSWSLSNIFEVIKCLLIVPFPESALNEEAGKIFMEDYDEYFKRAKLYTEIYAQSKEKVVPLPPQSTQQSQQGSSQQPQQIQSAQISQNTQYQGQQSQIMAAGQIGSLADQRSLSQNNFLNKPSIIKENQGYDQQQQTVGCYTHKENDRSRDYYTRFTPTKQENLLLENNSNMMLEELPKSDQKNQKSELSNQKNKQQIPINLTFTSSFQIQNTSQILSSQVVSNQYQKKENDKKKWLKRI